MDGALWSPGSDEVRVEVEGLLSRLAVAACLRQCPPLACTRTLAHRTPHTARVRPACVRVGVCARVKPREQPACRFAPRVLAGPERTPPIAGSRIRKPTLDASTPVRRAISRQLARALILRRGRARALGTPGTGARLALNSRLCPPIPAYSTNYTTAPSWCSGACGPHQFGDATRPGLLIGAYMGVRTY